MEKRKLVNKLKRLRKKLKKMRYTPKNALIVTGMFMEIEKDLEFYSDCKEKDKCLNELKLTYDKEMINFFRHIKSDKKTIDKYFDEYSRTFCYDIEHCLMQFGVTPDQY